MKYLKFTKIFFWIHIYVTEKGTILQANDTPSTNAVPSFHSCFRCSVSCFLYHFPLYLILHTSVCIFVSLKSFKPKTWQTVSTPADSSKDLRQAILAIDQLDAHILFL